MNKKFAFTAVRKGQRNPFAKAPSFFLAQSFFDLSLPCFTAFLLCYQHKNSNHVVDFKATCHILLITSYIAYLG
jgi:hypothetical protein